MSSSLFVIQLLSSLKSFLLAISYSSSTPSLLYLQRIDNPVLGPDPPVFFDQPGVDWKGDNDPTYVRPFPVTDTGRYIAESTAHSFRNARDLYSYVARPYLRLLQAGINTASVPFEALAWPLIYGTASLTRDAIVYPVKAINVPLSYIPGWSRLLSLISSFLVPKYNLRDYLRNPHIVYTPDSLAYRIVNTARVIGDRASGIVDILEQGFRDAFIILYKPLRWTDQWGFRTKARVAALTFVVLPLAAYSVKKTMQALFPKRLFVLVKDSQGNILSVPLPASVARSETILFLLNEYEKREGTSVYHYLYVRLDPSTTGPSPFYDYVSIHVYIYISINLSLLYYISFVYRYLYLYCYFFIYIIYYLFIPLFY